MKRLLLTILALCFTLPAFGQLAMRLDKAQTVQGGIVRPLPGAYIKVCAFAEDKSCPDASKIAIYKDPQGTKPLANPFRADNQGNYQYFFLGTQNLVEQVTYPSGPSYAQYVAYAVSVQTDNFWSGTNYFKNVNGTAMADQFSGADACSKIAAAIASGASTVDARGFPSGTYTCSNPAAWAPNRSLVIKLGNYTLQVTDTLVVGTNVKVEGWWGSVIQAAPTFSSTYVNNAGNARPAVVVLGESSVTWAPYASLHGVSVKCNNVTGCIGVYSQNIQEFGGLYSVFISGYDTYAAWFEKNGTMTPQNFALDGVWAIAQNPAGSAAKVIYFSGGGNQPFRYIRDVTIDNGGDIKAGSVGIQIDSGFRGEVLDVHCEEMETCTQVTNGVELRNIDMIGGTNTVLFPTGAVAVAATNISHVSGTNSLVATDCGITLTSTTQGTFRIGGGTDKACTYNATDTALKIVASRVALDTTGFNLFNSNKVILASDYTTTADTNLHTVVTMSLPPNHATSYSFQCSGAYSQATATGGVKFGVWAQAYAPTNVFAVGTVQTDVASHTSGVLTTLATTTATNVVAATPGAVGTDYVVRVSGTIELPSNGSAQSFRIMAGTANASDLVTVRRGFQCQVF